MSWPTNIGGAGATRQLRHPVAELLARYGAIVKAAWDAREQLAGPARLADERAFLPAAMALQETPPHPAPRRAALAICLLFLIALLWACLGQIDIVAVAQGRIKVSDGSKLIQPLEASVVRAIHVKDGDHVQAGQPLIELDSTQADADRSRVAEDQSAAASEFLRTGALLYGMTHDTTPRLAGEIELVQLDRPSAKARLVSEWADIQGKLTRLKAEINRHRAETQTVDRQVDKLEATVPMARRREADFQTLADQGFVANHVGQDRTRDRLELEKDLATARAHKIEVVAALNESQQALAAQQAETIRSLHDRRANAHLRLQQLAAESTKASRRSRLAQLIAPVDGTIQQLAVHTAGGVVTPAQTLLVIVPDRADVLAEVRLENKDIGFVRDGQRATIKFETFPYTRYGTVEATVVHVAADVVSPDEISNDVGSRRDAGSARNDGAIFPTTLRLNQKQIDVDGRLVHISPGMNISAEIKTGRRRVIEFLLSPVQQHFGESLQER